MFQQILLKILLIASIVTSSCFADTIPYSVILKKDQPSPYDGVLLNKLGAQKVLDTYNDLDKERELNFSLENSLDASQKNESILEKEASELQKDNTTLQVALTKSNQNGFWNKALWFGLGLLTTGAIVYAARR